MAETHNGDPEASRMCYLAGSSMLKNVHPFVAGYRYGSVGIAHNGNLVNYKSLRAELEDSGSIFNTSSDTEVVLRLIAISKLRPFFLRIVKACEKLEGAYSMVFVTDDKLLRLEVLAIDIRRLRKVSQTYGACSLTTKISVVE